MVLGQLFYGFATYGNAGFLREQVCKYMCPYARFQSAMFDKRHDGHQPTTPQRGEPRGSRPKSLGHAALCRRRQSGRLHRLHAFVCRCVPVGIDIRKGLQYECIGCSGVHRRVRLA